jgi:hypothetical protein
MDGTVIIIHFLCCISKWINFYNHEVIQQLTLIRVTSAMVNGVR